MYEVPFLGRIPTDPNFGFELDNGRNFEENFKNSATAKSISQIVENISQIMSHDD